MFDQINAALVSIRLQSKTLQNLTNTKLLNGRLVYDIVSIRFFLIFSIQNSFYRTLRDKQSF